MPDDVDGGQGYGWNRIWLNDASGLGAVYVLVLPPFYGPPCYKGA